MNHLRITIILVLCVLFTFTFLPQRAARATTLTVTTTADSGPGSLREAISLAAPGDTIVYDASMTSTITVISSPLLISKNLTIQGWSPSTVAISGNGSTRLLEISAGVTVSISEMRFQNGKAATAGTAGGITNAGNLTLTNVKLLSNQSEGIYEPSALYNTGTLNLTNVTVSENTGPAPIINAGGNTTITQSAFINNSYTGVGAIINQDSGAILTIRNSLFSGNTGSQVGAIDNGIGSQLTLEDSIISNNSATFNDYRYPMVGAIRNQGTLRISRTAITGNTAVGNKGILIGGIYNAEGSLEIVNSTIANNAGQISPLPPTVCDSWYCPPSTIGGIYTFGTATVYLTNSTIADNEGMVSSVRVDPSSPVGARNTIIKANSDTNCNVPIANNDGNNLQYPGTSCGGSITTADPKLGTLQFNGGYGQTMALLDGSPAIDAGDNTTCTGILVAGKDQRQNTRPVDGDGNGSAICDIGAYEASKLIVTNLNNSGAGSLRDTINAAASGAVITFHPSLAGGTITVTTPLVISKSLTIQGLLPNKITLSGGNTTAVINVQQGVSVGINDINITNGLGNAPFQGGLNENHGGGINNWGNLSLNNVTLSNNQGTTAGAIFNSTNATLHIANSLIINNTSPGTGSSYNAGGIVNFWVATIAQSSVLNNTGNLAGGITNGIAGSIMLIDRSIIDNNTGSTVGGIMNGDELTIMDSRISANEVLNSPNFDIAGGVKSYHILRLYRTSVTSNHAFATNPTTAVGGIYAVSGDVDSLVLGNVTVAGNSASSGSISVGGIQNALGLGEIYHSTIVDNSGTYSTIYLTGGGTLTMSNTILKHIGTGCNEALNNGWNNVQYPNATCGSMTVADPKLGTLELHGAYAAYSLSLLSGSPAIDTGWSGWSSACTTAPVLSVDARGVQRPVDGDGDGHPFCDIGAYEFTVSGGSPTNTPTRTYTPTRTLTPSRTPTRTPTPSLTPTRTFTPSSTPTRTISPTASITPISTPTATPISLLPTNTRVPKSRTQVPLVNGLRGFYYNNADLTTLVLSRLDPTVNFNWLAGSPDASIGADTFSVRWTGSVVPQYSQPYRFYVEADGGVRLWINGVMVINSWVDATTTRTSTVVTLTAGTRYPIQLDYFENTGNAKVILYWSSTSQPKQVIPTTRLFTRP